MTPTSEMRAAAEKATPGPWRWWTSNSWRRLRTEERVNRSIIEPFVARDGHPDLSVTAEDMAFIEAATPTNVLALLDDLDRVNALNEQLGDANDALRARVAELEASARASEAGHRLSGLSELNERVRLQNKCSDLAEEKAAAEASRDALAGMMARCRTVLGNMAAENEGAIFNRWPINHEPLRADARNLLPVIDALLTPAEKV